jgi:hypothetical protein
MFTSYEGNNIQLRCFPHMKAIIYNYDIQLTSYEWWKKPECPETTTDRGQATGKLYHLRLQDECTLFCNSQSWARTHAVLVIGLYELLDPTYKGNNIQLRYSPHLI